MVAVVEHKIGDVAVGPFGEEAGVAILALGIDPHVETLGHDHHAHRVAHSHLHRRRHIVGRTDSVGTHLLHHAYLPDKGGLVFGSADWTEVVVQTDTLQLARNAVEPEAAVARNAHGADADTAGRPVNQTVAAQKTRLKRIEIRGLGRPQAGIGYLQRGSGIAVGIKCGRTVAGDHPSISITERPLYGEPLSGGAHLCIERHIGPPAADGVGTEVAAPSVETGLVGGGDETDGAEQTAAGIPARRLLAVVQTHADGICPLAEVGSHIYPEGIVAIGPVTGQPTIDIDVRFGHGSVETEQGRGGQCFHIDRGAVKTASDPRKGSRAARLLGLLGLAVLLDGYILQVVLLVKRSVDGPVVGHRHGRIVDAVAGKLPCGQFTYATLLGKEARGSSEGENGYQYSFHSFLIVGVCFIVRSPNVHTILLLYFF